MHACMFASIFFSPCAVWQEEDPYSSDGTVAVALGISQQHFGCEDQEDWRRIQQNERYNREYFNWISSAVCYAFCTRLLLKTESCSNF